MVTKILVCWNIGKEGLFGWSPVMVWGVRVEKKMKTTENVKNLKRKNDNMSK